ncbi:hypothetical protein F4808DRAFT_303799 [Astrocystis sublimbata]|nr:hypothetical protein F4808DRAFT_303799 [Astrocystis sublimbata]
MATNSGRGNVIAASDDAPKGGADVAPPPVSSEVKEAVAKEASSSAAVSDGAKHASGQEPGMEPDPTPKVEVEVEVPPKDGR